MNPTILSPVGQTAGWTATARAIETDRPSSLFTDPYAQALGGDDGLRHFSGAHSIMPKRMVELMVAAIAIRTRFFDDAINAAVSRGVRQVVILAAGFDTRAFRLPFPNGVTTWELDREEIFEMKEPVLRDHEAAPKCRRRTLAVDLRETWVGELFDSGFDPSQPSAILVEGLLAYLEPDEAHRVLDTVSEIAAPGSWLGYDVIGKTLIEFGPFKRQREWLAAQGSPFLFSTDDAEKLATSRGWTADSAVPGERNANYDRWPFPAFPRSMPGIPRNYYVTATR